MRFVKSFILTLLRCVWNTDFVRKQKIEKQRVPWKSIIAQTNGFRWTAYVFCNINNIEMTNFVGHAVDSSKNVLKLIYANIALVIVNSFSEKLFWSSKYAILNFRYRKIRRKWVQRGQVRKDNEKLIYSVSF